MRFFSLKNSRIESRCPICHQPLDWIDELNFVRELNQIKSNYDPEDLKKNEICSRCLSILKTKEVEKTIKEILTV